MAALLLIVAGWGVIGPLAVLDHRLAGNWVTPFTLFALPLQTVATLTVLLAAPLGFLAPAPGALLVLLAGPVVLWCGEAPVLAWAGSLAAAAGGADREAEEGAPWWGEDESRSVVLIASWVVIVVTAVAFVQAMRGVGPIGQIVQPEFQLRFGAGASGLVRPVAMLLVVYWIGTTRRWGRVEILTLVALLGALMASFVKGTVMLPVLGGLVYRTVAGRLRLTAGRVVALVVLGFALVFGVYLVQTVVWGLAGLAAPGFGSALTREVIAYVFAGVLGFSGTWQAGILPGPMDWTILISPLWNLIAHLGGFARVANVPSAYLYIDLRAAGASPLGTSNVRTLFGTLWTFAGPLGAVAATLALGVGTGLLYAAARRARNCWLLVVSSFLGAALAFGWFEYYFWHSFWYTTLPLGVLAALAARRRQPSPILEGTAS